MTERARRRRALARAPARVRTGARRVCSAHLVMRSPRTRVAPALTRALPPSRNRVFTGRHLRLYRQDRDRAHRARQAPHPDPGCQPQGAHPPPRLRTKRRTEKPRLPALSNRLRPRDRAIARATRGAERNARATREKNTSRVLVPIPVRRARPRPPPRVRDRGGGDATVRLRPPRKDGGDAFPSRPRASGVFARATWRSRGRYLVIFRASEPVSKKVFSRVFEKSFFTDHLTPLFSSQKKNRSCPARSLGTPAS